MTVSFQLSSEVGGISHRTQLMKFFWECIPRQCENSKWSLVVMETKTAVLCSQNTICIIIIILLLLISNCTQGIHKNRAKKVHEKG